MKYFTIATEADPPSHDAYGRRHSRWRRNSDDVVLVFGSDDDNELTDDALDLIAVDQHVKKIMQGSFIVSFAGDQILVHQTLELIPLPDTAPLDVSPVLLCRKDGPPIKIDTRRLFDTCSSLFRAIGCTNCPDKETACISRVYSETQPYFNELNSKTDFSDLRETFKNRQTKLAGFMYISPMLTRVSASYDHFAPYQRSWGDHDFKQVKSWSKQRSKANEVGAERRQFKKTQCITCPLRLHCQYSCRSRYCTGAFPSEPAIDAQLLEVYTRFAHSTKLKSWQFNVIAQMAGAEGIIGRRHCILDGFVRRADMLVIQAHRNKTDAQLVQEWRPILRDYESVAAYFELPKTEDEAKAQLHDVTDCAKALWAASLDSTHVARQSAGWGYCKDYIGYRKLRPHNLEIGVRDSKTVWTDRAIHTWNDYADVIGDPPVSQNLVR